METFIFDSCYSVSQAQHLLGSSDSERSVTIPNGYYFQKDRNQPERSSSEQVPSYVTMSACCSSGQAWEHDGHGVFTTALLDVLRGETVTRLRYSDVTMLMEIDSRYGHPAPSLIESPLNQMILPIQILPESFMYGLSCRQIYLYYDSTILGIHVICSHSSSIGEQRPSRIYPQWWICSWLGYRRRVQDIS